MHRKTKNKSISNIVNKTNKMQFYRFYSISFNKNTNCKFFKY